MTPSTYNVNPEIVMDSRLRRTGPKFDKLQARPPIVDPKKLNQYDSIVYENIDKYAFKNGKYRKIHTPNLSNGV